MTTLSCQEIAANGVRLNCPGTWRLNEFNPTHLLLSEGDGLKLEVKWGRSRNPGSSKAHLRRLGKIHRRKFRIATNSGVVPDNWHTAVSTFESTGFHWEGQVYNGMGFLLHCPVCRTDTLIQFYLKSGETPASHCADILASYRDHPTDGNHLWNLFGIRALIPGSMSLIGHRFEPGFIHLEFKEKRQRLSLYRWGPASVLLNQQNFREFAVSAVQAAADIAPRTMTLNGHDTLEWKSNRETTPVMRMWNRLLPTPSHHWMRIWHHRPKNRIMGICSSDSACIDERKMERICETYETR
ncbi:MAG: hypothetical protein HKM93_12930 [Desulfobacteraceae bacterium]|nr:hypothetical protein [Desulfobacteraceae bacterium]